MASLREFRLPDLGDLENVDVVEVLVASGDRVERDDALIVLESDKATVEIPSPCAALIKEVRVAVGDRVREGDLIALLEVEEEAGAGADPIRRRPDSRPSLPASRARRA